MKRYFQTFVFFVTVLFYSSGGAQNVFTVTKTTDPDPFTYPYNYVDSLCDTTMYGTLQWAIRKANDAPDSSVIHFNITGSGTHTITLNYTLPTLNKPIKIDGTTQTGYDYNNGPLIIIDGTNIPYNSHCFSTSGWSERYVIKGICIRNFYLSFGIMVWGSNTKITDNIFQNVGGYEEGYYRAVGIYVGAPHCIIQGNILGTDTGGVTDLGTNAENIILQNQWLNADSCIIGGEGTDESNTITHSTWTGIGITNGKNNKITRNRIYNNSDAINLTLWAGADWWGNQGKPSPVIDTIAPTGILSGTSEANDTIEIFGSTGAHNANEYITTTVADTNGNWSVAISNYDWDYLVATATDDSSNTSELSSPFEIEMSCLAEAGSNDTICLGDTVQLMANDGFTYHWASMPSDSSLIGQDSLQNPLVSPSASTTYTVSVSNAMGCTQTDTVVVNLYEILKPGSIGNSQTVCYNASPAAFTATAPAGGTGSYAYYWQEQQECTGSWTDIAGAVSSTYQPNESVQTICYRRKVISGCDSAYSNTIAQGLKARYPFDGKFLDRSGNNYHGTNYGALWTTDKDNTTNSAINFTGSQYVDLNYGSGLNPATTPHTFSFWTKPSAIGTNIMIMSAGQTGGTNNRFYIGINGGKWDMGIQTAYWGSGTINATTDWTHLALVIDGTTAKLYVNGNVTRTISYTSYNFNRNIWLANHDNNYYYQGKIDEVQIFDRALTYNEIYSMYHDAIKVTVHPLPTANAGPDTLIFAGDSVQIGTDAIAGYTYAWSPGAGLSDSTVARPWAMPDTTTIYYLTVTDTATGCTQIDTIRVFVILGSTCDKAVEIQTETICTPYTFELAAGQEEFWISFIADTTFYYVSYVTPSYAPVSNIERLELYKGNCNNDTLVAYKDVSNGDFLEIVDSNFVIGRTYFIKIISDSAANSYFSLCVNRRYSVLGLCFCNPQVHLPDCEIVSNGGFEHTDLFFNFDPDCLGWSSSNYNDFNPRNVCCWSILSSHPSLGAGYNTIKGVMLGFFNNTYGEPIRLDGIRQNLQRDIISNAGYTLKFKYKTDYSPMKIYVGLANNLLSGPGIINQQCQPNPNVTIPSPNDVFIIPSDTITCITSGSGWQDFNVHFVSPNNNNQLIVYATHYDVDAPMNHQICVNIDNISIVPDFEVNITGTDVDVCHETEVPLSALASLSPYLGYDYVWSNGYPLNCDDLNASTPCSTTVTPTVTTTYTITATDNIGCIATDEITIEVFDYDSNPAGVDDTICLGQGSATLIAQCYPSNNCTYQWTDGTNIWYTQQITVHPNATTTYYLQLVDGNGCTTNDEVIVVVNNLPTANAGSDTTVCINEPIHLNATGGVYYQWSSEPAGFTSNLQNPSVLPSVTTTYTVTVTDENGCSDTDDIIVSILPLPEPEITVTGLPCYNSPDLTFHSETFSSYSWNFGDPGSGTSNYSTAQNPTHSFSMPGTFQVTLTVEGVNGCFGCTSYVLEIAPHCCAFDTAIVKYNDNDAEFLSGEISDISGQILWNTSLKFNKTLIIKAGNTLTIATQDTIEFGPFGKLIVENGDYNQNIEGAQLVMETGAILTSIFNTTGDECLVMWQGVEVWGNAALSHNATYAPYQGKLTMGIRAEINHAHIGVLLGRRNICFTNTCDNVLTCKRTPYLLNFSGGIIDACCSSKFRRDAVAVHFASYKYINASTIEDCTFEGGTLLDPGYNTNSAYVYQNNNISTSHNPLFGNANAGGRSDVGIYMWGIRFAPEYITTIPHYPFDNNTFTTMETGMLSFTSRYNVTESTFDNLTNGISIYNYNSPIQGNTIDSNQFKEISTNCIILNGCKYDKIKKNTLGITSQAQDYKCGVLINNSSNFNITDNDFNKLNTGIICYNSSKGGGNIKAKDRILDIDNTGNFFNRCLYNLKTYRNNARLNIKCNTADNPLPAEYSGMNWYNAGFPFSYLGHQGYADMLDNKRQAGNKFTPADQNFPSTDKNQIENAGWPYTYNAHPNVYARIPTKYNIVTPIQINTASANYVDGVSCATCLLPYCNISTRIMQNNDTIALFENELDTVRSNLDSSHTSAFLEAISSALTYEELADSLIHNAPLSDTVLKAFIVRDDSIIAASFLDVFLHNAPVSDTIWVYYMPELLSLLHEDTAQLITEAQSQFNVYRTPALIERYIEQLKSEKQMFLIEHITQLADSGYFNDAVKFLENENSSDAQQSIIAQYLYEGIADTALYKLNNFEPQTSADSAWKELMGILIGLEAGDSTVFDISEEQEDFIRELAYGEDINLAAVSAQAILRLLYGETFELDLSEPEPRKQTQDNTEKAQVQISENWDLYPNPARNYVNVQYQIPAASKGFVEMYSLIGEKVEHVEMPSGKNIVRIFTQKFSAGVYLVKLVVDNKYMGAKKLVILKK